MSGFPAGPPGFVAHAVLALALPLLAALLLAFALGWDAAPPVVAGAVVLTGAAHHILLGRRTRVADAYRAVLAAGGAARAEVDVAGVRLRDADEALAVMTGHSRAALSGRPLLDVVHPDDRDAARAAWARLREGAARGWRREERWIRRDGSIAWVELTAVAARPERALVAVRDVTRRRTIEAERDGVLAEAQAARGEALRRAWESDRLAAVNRELGGVLRVDAIARTMCRAARDLVDAQGSCFVVGDGDEVVYVEEDAVAPLWKGRRFPASACASGWSIRQRQRLVVPDVRVDPRLPHETYAPTFVRACALVPLPPDEPTAVLGVYWDHPHEATPREMALLEALAAAAAIGLRTATLYGEADRARRDAEAANRAKDEFIAVVSHELRSPLSAIRMWATLLRQTEMSAEQVQHGLGVIERNVEAQAQLVSDLLDVSRILTGKLHVDPQAADIAAVVHGAIDAVRAAADAKGVHIEAPANRIIHPVWGDPGRLQQVAWNILSNAVKFTSPGGRITVRLERKSSRYVQLVVSDTGEGIPAAVLPHVFERFRQADSTSTRRHGGLGLGLAIARHLVDLHGGRIEAASPGPGQGATFAVTLPIDLRPESATVRDGTENASAVARDLLDGMHVLVVDDDADARESLAAMLRAHGAAIRAASSVVEAVALVEREPPDVVVSDIAMPQIDGYELPKRLHAARPGGVPAIALTAFAAPTDRDRALQAGFRAHVSKPVDPERLLDLVARLGRDTATSA